MAPSQNGNWQPFHSKYNEFQYKDVISTVSSGTNGTIIAFRGATCLETPVPGAEMCPQEIWMLS